MMKKILKHGPRGTSREAIASRGVSQEASVPCGALQRVLPLQLLFSRLLAVMLCLAVASLLFPARVFAAEANTAEAIGTTKADALKTGTSKDEVVYAKLQQQGSVKGIYVVNTFRPDKAGTVQDFGDYSQVKNLTTLETLSQEGDRIGFDVAEDVFSYQGDLVSKELPWNIAIAYKLDGKIVKPEELAGKSGRLELTIKTSKNNAVSSLYYDNYLLQISTQFSPDKASNIETPSGQIALVGSDTQVTFTGMPGEDSAFELSAQVKEFEMQGITIAAIPFSMVIDVPDTDEYLSDFNLLINGVGEVSSGSIALGSGTRQLGVGAEELSAGADELNSGASELKSGAEELSTGATALSTGVTTLNAGADKLNKGASALAKGVPTLTSGMTGLKEYATAITDALKKSADGGTALVAGSAQVDTGLTQSSAGLSLLLQAMGNDPNMLPYLPNLTSISEGLTQLSQNYSTQVHPGIKNYAAGVKTISDLQKDYNTKFGQAADGVDEFANGVKDLSDGVAATTEGVEKTATGIEEFAEGVDQYAAGMGEYAEGVDQYAAGMDEFAGGVGELADGAEALADGTKELYKGTQKIPDEMQKKIDEMLAGYDKRDFEAESFVSPKNDNVKLVQFVISTDPISIPAVEEESEVVEEPGFLDRLLALFGR